MACAKTFLYDPFTSKKIEVSRCLANEIQWLWDNNITILDCDCGEREELGYIVVNEDSITKMKEMGYETYVYKDCERYDTFISKSYKHINKSYFS